jgi:prevent-host-death family protein
MITVTSVEAQNRFGQLLDMARREPVTVTRHGRPAAFIVSPQDMQDLLDVRARRSKAVQALEAWSARARAQATPAAPELSEDDVNRLVHELR